MRLQGAGKSSLVLAIVGYQFAAMTGDPGHFDYDANWLLIEGRASDGTRSWTFRDPCLLTVEARDLASWLEAVADGRSELEATGFTEPNLEFRRMSSPDESPTIRVTFRLESRSPLAPDPYDGDHWDDYRLDFDTSAAEVRAAADELGTELERFPER